MRSKGSVGWVLSRACLLAAVVAALAVIAALVAGRVASEKLAPFLVEKMEELTGQTCALDSVLVRLRGRLDIERLHCGDAFSIRKGIATVDWRRSLTTRTLSLSVHAEGLSVHLGRIARESTPPEQATEREQRMGTGLFLVPIGVRLEGREWQLTFPIENESAVLGLSSLRAEVSFDAHQDEMAIWSAVGEGIRWRRREQVVSMHKVSVHGRWLTEEGLAIDAGAMYGPQGRLALRRAQGEGLRVHARMDASVLAAFTDAIPLVHGDLVAIGLLRGAIGNPEVDVRFRLIRGAWNRIEQAQLRARFLRQGRRLRFERARLRHPALRAAGNVEFDLGTPATLATTVHGRVFSAEQVASIVGFQIPAGVVRGTAFSGALSGPLDPLHLEWSVTGRSHVQWPRLEVARTAPVGWRAGGLIAEREGWVDATASLSGAASLEAEHRWTPDGQQMGSGKLTFPSLEKLALLLGPVGEKLGLTGQGLATGKWRIAGGAPELEVEVEAKEVTVLQSRLRAVTCAMRNVSSAGGVIAADCSARGEPGGSLEMRGQWSRGREVQLGVSMQDFPAEFLAGASALVWGEVLPLSRGRVTGELSLTQRESGWELTLSGVMKQFRLWQEPVTSLSYNVEARQGRWALRSELSRRDGTERLRLEAEGEGSSVMRASLTGDPIRLGGIVGLGRRGIDGVLVVDGQWSGALASLSGHLNVVAEELQVERTALGRSELTVDFAPKQWIVRGDLFGGRLEVQGKVDPRASYRFDVSATMEEMNIVAPRGRLQVTVEGHAAASGQLARARLERLQAALTKLVLVREPYRLQAKMPVQVRFESGVFHLDPFELASDNARIQVQGSGSPRGELALEIRGMSDLLLLELLGSPIVEASGPVSIDARIGRSGQGQWWALGRIAVDNATLEIEGFPPLSELHGQATLANDAVQNIDLEGRVGDGKLELTGHGSLQSGFELVWKLQDVAGNWGEDLEARLSGSGKIQGNWSEWAVAGDIEVLSGLYDRDVALTDLLRWLRERLFAPRPVQTTLRAPVSLDLKIHSPGNVFLDNNVAKVELWLDVWVGGTVGRPFIGGRVGVVDGEVTVQGRTFTLTSGAIEFRDPTSLNPWLDFVAETRVPTAQAEYLVTAHVTGQADRPRVQFSADDPSLSPEDILSLLATGRTRAMAAQSGGFSAAGAALAVLPKREAEQQLQRWLGVDQFDLSAAQARDTGAVEPRVTVGKEINEWLYASASTSVGAQTRQTVQLEYRWTRRVSLLGSWESATQEAAGAFSGGIKFRVEFVRLPFSLACP